MITEPNYKITNNDTGAVIEIDLPGANKDSIELNSENDTLKVHAPREINTPENWQLINQAIKPEGYELNLKLEPTLNIAAAKAKLENAVLTLTISKHEASLPKEIPILN